MSIKTYAKLRVGGLENDWCSVSVLHFWQNDKLCAKKFVHEKIQYWPISPCP